MNRQERRRHARQGKRGPAWDLIITATVAVAIVLIWGAVLAFPNLDLATFEKASPRIINKAVNRSINWLVEDESGFVKFNFGYLSDPEENEWISYLVHRADSVTKFTNSQSKEVLEIQGGEALPDFYKMLPEAIADLQAAVKDNAYELKFQQATDVYNVFTLTKETGEGDDVVRDQYILALDTNYKIDYLARVTGKEGEATGYSFSNLYSPAETETE